MRHCKWGTHFQYFHDILRQQGMAGMKALNQRAALCRQELQLLFIFDTFGHR